LGDEGGSDAFSIIAKAIVAVSSDDGEIVIFSMIPYLSIVYLIHTQQIDMG
jgi:hypothetical protein